MDKDTEDIAHDCRQVVVQLYQFRVLYMLLVEHYFMFKSSR